MRLLPIGRLTLLFLLAGCGSPRGESLFRLSDAALPLSIKTQIPARRPLLLVPGWGYRLTGLVVGQEAWARYIEWLVTDGYAREDIHVLSYHYRKGLDYINAELTTQFRAIVASYPAGTKFDVMGHSLGGFTSLAAIVDSGVAPRVQKYISLSGIPFGWDSWYCAAGVCGKADRQLTPFKNDFVTAFHSANAEAIAALEKCSVFSPDDEFVKPYDAGRFADGTNIEIAGIKHMDTIWTQQSYRAMRHGCYGE